MTKVIVGMSGGVDSSVTAHLLKNQGYEAEGISFILYEARLKKIFTGCCSIEAINDAKRTAEQLGVKHTAIDLRDKFMEKVIEPFIEAYLQGITPNPCILCNKHIKFPYLLKTADEKGAEFIATGHYARISDASCVMRHALKDKNASRITHNGLRLLKGIDPKKDQSYVLYVLRQEELGRLKLPLGEKTKDEVREIARRLNLPAAKMPESQEICFIEDKNYFKFLENLAEHKEGDVIDIETGNVLGRHKGVHLYTIGQRKRLGIAAGRPLFVTKIDPSKNAVYVGPRESAMIKEFVVEDVNWLIPEVSNELIVTSNEKSDSSQYQSVKVSKIQSIKDSDTLTLGNSDTLSVTHYSSLPFRASVKVRSMMKDEPATVLTLNNNMAKVIYDVPQWAPAPGQSAVFYSGDIVIGGGIISALC